MKLGKKIVWLKILVIFTFLFANYSFSQPIPSFQSTPSTVIVDGQQFRVGLVSYVYIDQLYNEGYLSFNTFNLPNVRGATLIVVNESGELVTDSQIILKAIMTRWVKRKFIENVGFDDPSPSNTGELLSRANSLRTFKNTVLASELVDKAQSISAAALAGTIAGGAGALKAAIGQTKTEIIQQAADVKDWVIGILICTGYMHAVESYEAMANIISAYQNNPTQILDSESALEILTDWETIYLYDHTWWYGVHSEFTKDPVSMVINFVDFPNGWEQLENVVSGVVNGLISAMPKIYTYQEIMDIDLARRTMYVLVGLKSLSALIGGISDIQELAEAVGDNDNNGVSDLQELSGSLKFLQNNTYVDDVNQRIYDDQEFHNILIQELNSTVPPSLIITEPSTVDVEAWEFYVIPYTYLDQEKDGTIKFFYDSSSDLDISSNFEGFIGEKEYSKTSTEWVNSSIVWDLRQVPEGSYHVYGIIDNGDSKTSAYSSGTVLVQEIPVEDNLDILSYQVIENPGDGDGIPESGELLEIRIRFRNKSGKDLWDLKGTILEVIPNTSIIEDSEVSFGQLSSGDTMGYHDYDDDFDITVKPDDYDGPFIFSIRFQYREFGGHLIHEYGIVSGAMVHPDGATAPKFRIIDIDVEEDDDNDGIIESGEDIKFEVKLENCGNATAANVDAEFDPIIEATLTDRESYPDIPISGSKWSDGTYKLNDIPMDFSGDLAVNLNVYYGEDGNFSDTNIPYTITVHPTPHLYLLPKELDFGVKRPSSGPIDVEFTVTNRGSDTLHVSAITSSHISDTQIIGTISDIAPGGSDSFTARVDISGLEGSITRTVTIVSDAHSPTDNILTITGIVSNLKQPVLLGAGRSPDIYDGYIIWDNGGKIYIKNTMVGTLTIVEQTGEYYSQAKIHEYGGNHVVAMRENNDDDIWIYTIETGQLEAICTANGDQEDPEIHDKFVVWRDARNGKTAYGGSDIYGYNLETNSEFSIEIGDGDNFDIALGDGTIAWHKQRVIGGTGHHYILTKTLPNGSEYEKTLGSSPPTGMDNPSFSGQNVIFDEADSDRDRQLWKYNISTHNISQITTFADDHVDPDIWGCKAVYEDRRGTRAIYMVDVCSPNGENPVAVNDVNQFDPAIWGEIVAWQESSQIYAVSLSGKDLSVDLDCPSGSLPVGEAVTFNAHISNVGDQSISNLPVNLYVNGIQVAGTTVSSIAEGASIEAVLIWTPLNTGSYEVCVVAELPEDFTAISDCCTITIVNSDLDPPNLSNLLIEEHSGDGDGKIDDGDYVKISWDLMDDSGICNVSFIFDGQPKSIEGSYYVIVGPLSEGSYDYTITSDDCISPANYLQYNGNIQVFEQPAILSIIPCGQNDVFPSSIIEIHFNMEMISSSVNTDSVVLEDSQGTDISRTVQYIAAQNRVIITPKNLLNPDENYIVSVISGLNGIQSELSGWWPGGDYTCSFTTLAISSPIIWWFGVSDLSPTSATLSASSTPNGASTDCCFDYGPADIGYDSTECCINIGNGWAPTLCQISIVDLTHIQHPKIHFSLYFSTI